MSGAKTANADDDLKSWANRVRKQPMNCAIGEGDRRAELLMHPSRGPKMLQEELKGMVPKLHKPAYGVAFMRDASTPELPPVPGEHPPTALYLNVNVKPASKMAKLLAMRLRKTGLKPVVIMVAGVIVDAGEDPDDAPVPDGAKPASAELAGDQMRTRLRDLGSRIGTRFAKDPAGRTAATRLLASAVQAMDGGKLAEAGNLLQQLETSIGPEQAAWQPVQPGPDGSRPARGPVIGQRQPQPAAPPPVFNEPQQAFKTLLTGAQSDIKAARGAPDSAAKQQLAGHVAAISKAVGADDLTTASAEVRKAQKIAVGLIGQQQRLEAQRAQYDRMAPVLAQVERTYFSETALQGMQSASLKPGKEFKAFTDAISKLKQDATPAACDTVESAAKAYLEHCRKAPSKSRERGAKQANAETAMTGARHTKLALELKAIGEPPWDEETALRAASLRAAFDFQTMQLTDTGGGASGAKHPKPDRRATPLKGAGNVSATFFLKGYTPAMDQDGKPTKDSVDATPTQFVFKPADGESENISGFPEGGGAVREALTKAVADKFAAQTGLQLGVPETSVVTIQPDALDVASYNEAQLEKMNKGQAFERQIPTGQPLTGSMQQFANADGNLQKYPDELPPFPAEACQRVAILDILTLNTDRHSGNIMVTKTDGAPPGMIPIDHGLAFPTEDGLDARAQSRMNEPRYNILLSMPGSYEAFTPEIIQRLEMLEPSELAAEMKESRAALKSSFDQEGVDKFLPDEAVNFTERAAMFLKLACNQLSPAVIQIALAARYETLLKQEHDPFEPVAQEVINVFAPHAAAIKRLFCDLRSDLPRIKTALAPLDVTGWPANGLMSDKAFRVWLSEHATEALQAYSALADAG